MTKISEQVRVLSILSAKLPLKYKDQFLVILVFPDSISLVQTLLDFLPVSSDFGWCSEIESSGLQISTGKKSRFAIFLLFAFSAIKCLLLLSLSLPLPVHYFSCFSRASVQMFQRKKLRALKFLYCTVWQTRKTAFDTMGVFHYDGEKRPETTFPNRHDKLILMVQKTAISWPLHYCPHVIIIVIISGSNINHLKTN